MARTMALKTSVHQMAVLLYKPPFSSFLKNWLVGNHLQKFDNLQHLTLPKNLNTDAFLRRVPGVSLHAMENHSKSSVTVGPTKWEEIMESSSNSNYPTNK